MRYHGPLTTLPARGHVYRAEFRVFRFRMTPFPRLCAYFERNARRLPTVEGAEEMAFGGPVPLGSADREPLHDCNVPMAVGRSANWGSPFHEELGQRVSMRSLGRSGVAGPFRTRKTGWSRSPVRWDLGIHTRAADARKKNPFRRSTKERVLTPFLRLDCRGNAFQFWNGLHRQSESHAVCFCASHLPTADEYRKPSQRQTRTRPI